MPNIHYESREEAFTQLDRLVGTWVDEEGGESTYEWLSGRNFMIQKVGKDGSSGIEVIGYDAASGLIKTSFYASDESMLDNGGRPINYILSLKDQDYEMALDMSDRHGSFVGKLTDNDTVLTGRWEWVQKGQKMSYDSRSVKQ